VKREEKAKVCRLTKENEVCMFTDWGGNLKNSLSLRCWFVLVISKECPNFPSYYILLQGRFLVI